MKKYKMCIRDRFVEGALMKTEAKTAELSKCMENTLRDVNIALANELAKICTKIGVNALDVIEMANNCLLYTSRCV